MGLLATGALLLYQKRSPPVTDSSGSIGSVRPVGSDIRVKGESEHAWNAVARDSSVFRNDRVYTGQNSRAKVTLKNQQKFTVEPNSLIVITDDDKKQVLDFTTGGIFAELKKGLKLVVKHQGKETELTASENATVRLSSVQGGALKLTVLKGEAELHRAGKEQPEKVTASSELNLSDPASTPVASSYNLLLPRPGEEKWSQHMETEFQWTKSPAGGESRVEVATDPEFKQIVASGKTSSPGLKLRLPGTATYFWRVSSVDARSPVSSFSILALLPPQISSFTEIEIEPDQNGRSPNPINFSWNDQIASEEYDLELAHDREFLNIVETRKVRTASSAIPSLELGRYYWRVRSKSPGRESLLSNTGELVLKTKDQQISMPVADAKKTVSAAPPETVSPTPRAKAAAPLAKSFRPRPKIKPVEEPAPDTDAGDRSPGAVSPDTGSASTAPLNLDQQQSSSVKHWVWAGSGYNYQYYQQSIPSVDGSAKFNNVQGPTAIVRAGFEGDTMGLDASYKSTPGRMESSSSVDVTNGNYNWQTFTLEGLYRLSALWNVRFGVQHHIMPFMVLDPNTATVDVDSNTLTLATLGVDRSFPLSPKWRAEWMMRYQQPLMANAAKGASFSVDPKFAFDGSVGTVYNLSDQLRLGFYWYGQWHRYSFSYSSSSTSRFSGEQTLFYSNIEARFGFEF